MTVPTIPTEDDFVAMQDEALQNNRANGLPAKAPTENKLLEAFHRVIIDGCKCDFRGSLDGDCYHSGDCCDLKEAYEEINSYAEGKTK